MNVTKIGVAILCAGLLFWLAVIGILTGFALAAWITSEVS